MNNIGEEANQILPIYRGMLDDLDKTEDISWMLIVATSIEKVKEMFGEMPELALVVYHDQAQGMRILAELGGHDDLYLLTDDFAGPLFRATIGCAMAAATIMSGREEAYVDVR